MEISVKVRKIIPYLICIIVFFYLMKPSISFKPNGQLRNYGFGSDADGYKKTVYTMQNFIIFITILLYYMISIK